MTTETARPGGLFSSWSNGEVENGPTFSSGGDRQSLRLSHRLSRDEPNRTPASGCGCSEGQAHGWSQYGSIDDEATPGGSDGEQLGVRRWHGVLPRGSLSCAALAQDVSADGSVWHPVALDNPRGAVKNAFPASGEYLSGQQGQTVNLLAYAFGGSNPSSPIEPAARRQESETA